MLTTLSDSPSSKDTLLAVQVGALRHQGDCAHEAVHLHAAAQKNHGDVVTQGTPVPFWVLENFNNVH